MANQGMFTLRGHVAMDNVTLVEHFDGIDVIRILFLAAQKDLPTEGIATCCY